MKQLSRPKRSRAFQDLKGTVAQNLSADQYDQIVEAAYLEETNRELLNDISLIGGSKQSPGGPRAGTSKVIEDAATDTGSRVLFTANTGEVFLFEEMTMAVVTTGTWTLALDMIVGGITMPIIPTTSKTDTFLLMSQAFGWPTANMYLDENVTLFITLGGTFDSVTSRLLMTRYR
jgi:hypothetical protein